MTAFDPKQTFRRKLTANWGGKFVGQVQRRRFLTAAGLLLGAPLVSFAQQHGKVCRVGFLSLRRVASLDSDFYGAFPQGMRELGYVEGKNLVIVWRSAEGRLTILGDG